MDSGIFWTHDPKIKEIVRWNSCICSYCGGKSKPHKGDKIVSNKGFEIDWRQMTVNKVMKEF